MAIEKDEHGNLTITGDDIQLYQLIALRRMLEMEVKSPGMGFSKGSPLQTLKNLGVVPDRIRTKRNAVIYLNELFAEWDSSTGRKVYDPNAETSKNKSAEKNNG